MTGSDLTARVAGAYSTLAPRWDTSGAAWNQPVATRLLALAGLAPGMCILDAGCGAGAVSIPAARAVAPGGRVTGIDLAGPMLTRAQQAALAEGLTNVVFLNVDASEPSFGPASFDAVLASFVVYLLADPAATVARWRNLLRPGGILAFTWVIAEDPRLEPVYAAVDEFLPDGQEGWNAFRQRHGWTSVGRAEALLDGCRDVRTVVEPVTTRYESPEHWWESSWTQAPALVWRHIPVSRRDQARDVAFRTLEGLRDGDGSIARVRTVCYTLARQAPSGPREQVGSVWVRAQGDVLVRADAIVVLALGPEGLRAECGTGAAVRLAGTPCSTALMLGLAEAIDRAGRGDSRAVIITPPAEPGSATWQWEFADTLLERC